ncbi:MAG: hypothetical protein FWF25_01370 [Propionibacteriaceae bacterium]|nr:hypothetical protein [Propionibacteriaceae bacterium]
MIIQCDDDLYRVDRVFLGPPGKPWPFRMAYRGYGFWAGLLVVGVILWRLARLPWNVVVFVAILVAAWFGAQWLDKHLTADRPISAEISRIFQELTAPRPDLALEASATTAHVGVERWRAGAAPPKRWWQRAATAITAGPSRAASKALGKNRGRIFVNGAWQDVN